jgi:hypothetical protein
MTTVELTRGFKTVVDAEDFPRVSLFKWRAQSLGKRGVYAGRTVHEKAPYKTGHRQSETVLLHRFIMEAPEGAVVDHIDGDPLNNSRKNLRVCSFTENLWNQGVRSNNTSGHKGVYRKKDKKRNPWLARIAIKGRRLHLGYYATEAEAASAYEKAARNLQGEFCRESNKTQIA